jgi:hypothetical protein
MAIFSLCAVCFPFGETSAQVSQKPYAGKPPCAQGRAALKPKKKRALPPFIGQGACRRLACWLKMAENEETM